MAEEKMGMSSLAVLSNATREEEKTENSSKRQETEQESGLGED